MAGGCAAALLRSWGTFQARAAPLAPAARDGGGTKARLRLLSELRVAGRCAARDGGFRCCQHSIAQGGEATLQNCVV